MEGVGRKEKALLISNQHPCQVDLQMRCEMCSEKNRSQARLSLNFMRRAPFTKHERGDHFSLERGHCPLASAHNGYFLSEHLLCLPNVSAVTKVRMAASFMVNSDSAPKREHFRLVREAHFECRADEKWRAHLKAKASGCNRSPCLLKRSSKEIHFLTSSRCGPLIPLKELHSDSKEKAPTPIRTQRTLDRYTSASSEHTCETVR